MFALRRSLSHLFFVLELAIIAAQTLSENSHLHHGQVPLLFVHPTEVYSQRVHLSSIYAKRVPRRELKKRPNKRNKIRQGTSISPVQKSEGTLEVIETRPLIRSKSIEAGEDYWIDEEDLQRSLEKENAIKNRKAMEGEISKDKLRTEVVAPYKQNWIGIVSVMVILLALIQKLDPNMYNPPVIPLPDL